MSRTNVSLRFFRRSPLTSGVVPGQGFGKTPSPSSEILTCLGKKIQISALRRLKDRQRNRRRTSQRYFEHIHRKIDITAEIDRFAQRSVDIFISFMFQTILSFVTPSLRFNVKRLKCGKIIIFFFIFFFKPSRQFVLFAVREKLFARTRDGPVVSRRRSTDIVISYTIFRQPAARATTSGDRRRTHFVYRTRTGERATVSDAMSGSARA